MLQYLRLFLCVCYLELQFVPIQYKRRPLYPRSFLKIKNYYNNTLTYLDFQAFEGKKFYKIEIYVLHLSIMANYRSSFHRVVNVLSSHLKKNVFWDFIFQNQGNYLS